MRFYLSLFFVALTLQGCGLSEAALHERYTRMIHCKGDFPNSEICK